MSVNFGLPYMGSKSKIAADLIRLIPSGERFVDVFAGGCAMTHAAMLAGRWKEHLANDITGTPEFFVDVMSGKYNGETRWISREDFFRLKDTDPFVRFCFSFGNNGKDYIYSQTIEPYKKACHYVIFFDDWTDFQRLCPEVCMSVKKALEGIKDIKQRRLMLGPAVIGALKTMNRPDIVKKNPLYKSCHKKMVHGTNPDATYLESLERLERLQSLQSLDGRIHARKGDYRTLEVKPGDVLYCDPPYKGTAGYNGQEFDHEAFYDWACSQNVPVYISEYSMPADRFLKIWGKKAVSRLSQKGIEGYACECLFVPRKRIIKNI